MDTLDMADKTMTFSLSRPDLFFHWYMQLSSAYEAMPTDCDVPMVSTKNRWRCKKRALASFPPEPRLPTVNLLERGRA